MSDPFIRHQGIVAPLDIANVDTDQIIPKQFLKSIARTGFGEQLFFDWRYLEDEKPNPEFVLNQSPFDKASILLTRSNFGCGSSREHAVWAIRQFGFRAVIAPWKETTGGRLPAFADIFRNNSMKNSLLTIELSEAEVENLFEKVRACPGLEVLIDLEKQAVEIQGPHKTSYSFPIGQAEKKRLLEGLDDIGISLQKESEIQAFEAKHNCQLDTV